MDLTDKSIADLTRRCIELFKQCQLAHAATARQRFENRLADFHLWADGVGALAEGAASLDSRFNMRPDDLIVVKGVLTMLLDSLRESSGHQTASSGGGPGDATMQSIDSTLKDLALLGVAIRQAGKRSRLKRATKAFDPNSDQELKALRIHLEWLLRDHLTDGKLSAEQDRLIESNLRRRHWFLQAQQQCINLEGSDKPALPTPAEVHSNKKAHPKSQYRRRTATWRAWLHARLRQLSSSSKKMQSESIQTVTEGQGSTGTVGRFTIKASTADSAPLQGFPRGGRGIPDAPNPADETTSAITRLNASVSYPTVKVPDNALMFFCPCCCQVLPAETTKDKRWR